MVNKSPASLHKLIDDLRHVLNGDAVGHERQEPAIEKTLGDYVEIYYQSVEIGDFGLNEGHYLGLMGLEMNKMVKIHHPELLVFHQLHKSPEGLVGILDVIQQNGCQHVQTLDISKGEIISCISGEDSFEHGEKM